jgi:hypothetical protein
MNDDAIKSLCDAAMLAGIRYARQRGVEMTGDVCTRFLDTLRAAIKAALTKAIDEGRENPQLIPLLANALKVDAVHAGIEAAKAAIG